MNGKILEQLCSSVSQRRTAKVLRVNRLTVARKLKFLAEQARLINAQTQLSQPKAEVIEFDDMETFEHTKCKPLSITLAVESKTRRILGFEVSQMPAKGRLARISVKKYGPRSDKRYQGRAKLFEKLKSLVSDKALIKSDENPHYVQTVKQFFPDAKFERHKGQRGSTTGQGELKKIRFDPLFSLNHTCAMLRDNIKRLSRKTWCTTKLPARLSDHIAIYVLYHNLFCSPNNCQKSSGPVLKTKVRMASDL